MGDSIRGIGKSSLSEKAIPSKKVSNSSEKPSGELSNDALKIHTSAQQPVVSSTKSNILTQINQVISHVHQQHQKIQKHLSTTTSNTPEVQEFRRKLETQGLSLQSLSQRIEQVIVSTRSQLSPLGETDLSPEEAEQLTASLAQSIRNQESEALAASTNIDEKTAEALLS